MQPIIPTSQNMGGGKLPQPVCSFEKIARRPLENASPTGQELKSISRGHALPPTAHLSLLPSIGVQRPNRQPYSKTPPRPKHSLLLTTVVAQSSPSVISHSTVDYPHTPTETSSCERPCVFNKKYHTPPSQHPRAHTHQRIDIW